MPYQWTVRQMVAICTLLCSAPGMCDSCNGETEDNDWKVSVSANKNAREGWQLDVALEYLGKNTAELPLAAIPWEWPYAMTICAVSVDKFLILPISHDTIASDLPKGHSTVKPKQILKGKIPLRSLFNRWDRELEIAPVLVFWSYKPQTSNRVGGWLEIPQANERAGSDIGNGEWRVKVTPKKTRDTDWRLDWRLNIEIEYHGKRDTELPYASLPWKWPQAMTVCAVPANGLNPDPLPMVRIAGDPSMMRVSVKPGDVLRGEIAPLTLFSDTTDGFRDSPILVFWSLKVKSSNRVGGWFEINLAKKKDKKLSQGVRQDATQLSGKSTRSQQSMHVR
jgi:hypothetical protein